LIDLSLEKNMLRGLKRRIKRSFDYWRLEMSRRRKARFRKGMKACPICGSKNFRKVSGLAICHACHTLWNPNERNRTRWTCPTDGSDLKAFPNPNSKWGIQLWCSRCRSKFEVPDSHIPENKEEEERAYLIQEEI